jgi:ligand-binding sensor domain-containing protein
MNFKRFSNEDILAQNNIYDIKQDSKGFLWLATYGGLIKYDGYSFSKFKTDNANDNPTGGGLSTYPFYSLLENNDTMWAATYGNGVFAIDLRTNNFKHFTSSEKDTTTLSSNYVFKLTKYRNSVWLGLGTAIIDEWKGKSKGFLRSGTHGIVEKEFDESYFASLAGNDLWIQNSPNGCLRFYPEGRKVTRPYLYFTGRHGGDRIRCFYTDSKNKIWICCVNKIMVHDLQTHTTDTLYTRPPNTKVGNINFLYIIEDQNGLMWVGSDQGLYMIDPKTRRVKIYQTDMSSPYSLPNNVVNCVYEDRAGNIWIGTDDGLAKISPLLKKLSSYRFKENSYLSVRSLGVMDSMLLVGTVGDGLYCINGKRISNFKFDGITGSYGFNIVNSITTTVDKEILLGTHYSARKVDPVHFDARFIAPYPYSYGTEKAIPKSEVLKQTWSVFKDSSGNYWLGTKDSGLYVVKPDGTFLRHNMYTQHIDPTIRYSVWAMYQDKRKRLWLGSSVGLQKVILRNNRIEYTTYTPDKIRKPHTSNVVDIFEDRNGILWLALSDAGLGRFNPSNNQYTVYEAKAGLPSMVCSILQDKQGLLWLGTINGIFVFDPNNGKVVRSYNTTDGLVSNHFNFKSSCIDQKGVMYFGCSNGVIFFDPSEIRLNAYQPDIIVTSFKIQYQDENISKLRGSTVDLNYDKSTFSVEFATSDFTNPEKNQFAYKLAGLDKDWVYTGTNHYASFANLAPGKYVFTVKGTNSDGIWSPKTYSFNIIIRPPFWQTWWFYMLVSVIVLSIIGYILYLIFRNKDNKRRQVKSELAALRAQLNPHFVFNSLTSLQHFITAQDEELALRYLTRFAQLMRMILENSKQDTITLQEEVDFLKIYFFMESIRVDHKVDFRIEVDPELDTDNIHVPPMLLQPLIENSIIHGLVDKQPGGHIIIRFIKTIEFLQCEVEDNGIGRERAKHNKSLINIQKTSLGLNIIDERLKMLSIAYTRKAELNVIDLYTQRGAPAGTKIELKIPYL